MTAKGAWACHAPRIRTTRTTSALTASEKKLPTNLLILHLLTGSLATVKRAIQESAAAKLEFGTTPGGLPYVIQMWGGESEAFLRKWHCTSEYFVEPYRSVTRRMCVYAEFMQFVFKSGEPLEATGIPNHDLLMDLADAATAKFFAHFFRISPDVVTKSGNVFSIMSRSCHYCSFHLLRLLRKNGAVGDCSARGSCGSSVAVVTSKRLSVYTHHLVGGCCQHAGPESIHCAIRALWRTRTARGGGRTQRESRMSQILERFVNDRAQLDSKVYAQLSKEMRKRCVFASDTRGTKKRLSCLTLLFMPTARMEKEKARYALDLVARLDATFAEDATCERTMLCADASYWAASFLEDRAWLKLGQLAGEPVGQGDDGDGEIAAEIANPEDASAVGAFEICASLGISEQYCDEAQECSAGEAPDYRDLDKDGCVSLTERRAFDVVVDDACRGIEEAAAPGMRVCDDDEDKDDEDEAPTEAEGHAAVTAERPALFERQPTGDAQCVVYALRSFLGDAGAAVTTAGLRGFAHEIAPSMFDGTGKAAKLRKGGHGRDSERYQTELVAFRERNVAASSDTHPNFNHQVAVRFLEERFSLRTVPLPFRASSRRAVAKGLSAVLGDAGATRAMLLGTWHGARHAVSVRRELAGSWVLYDCDLAGVVVLDDEAKWVVLAQRTDAVYVEATPSSS